MADLDVLLRNDRYPRSAAYSARWMVDGAMGPNPVWHAEALAEVLPLESGMRVLDLGCGTALSSIFLAKEFDVEVWATDLWVQPHENLIRIAEADVENRVHPVFAEAHALPFAEGFFDALVSIGAYHYFGTDDLYLGYCSAFVKPGGWLGVVQPGLAEEYDVLPPPHLAPYWKWDFCAWHSPGWWRRHWEKTGLVTVELADRLPNGWQDWLQWNEVCDLANGTPDQEEARMLRADAGRALGLTRLVARRTT
ncbi:SAM-dependent methyltransferase [Kribbella shirazensis]|uniref:SAM-dependent methyltransferase n=1 Tax=Kribbella shirazensis TaxID=1105143 RepID=A0A7X5V6D1_9ACTN|nr:SAM-dependent methyltransferase [Kribbella shirazensis]